MPLGSALVGGLVGAGVTIWFSRRQATAVEGGRASDPKEKQDLMRKAAYAQGTALGFFRGFYEDIEKETRVIVEAAQKVSPGDMAEKLSSGFLEAKKEKQELDNQKS